MYVTIQLGIKGTLWKRTGIGLALLEHNTACNSVRVLPQLILEAGGPLVSTRLAVLVTLNTHSITNRWRVRTLERLHDL